jgi:hypothetical protein
MNWSEILAALAAGTSILTFLKVAHYSGRLSATVEDHERRIGELEGVLPRTVAASGGK